MSQQYPPDGSRPFTIFYEVVPTNVQDSDPAELQAVVDATAEALKKDGYTPTAVSTGTRGPELLLQVVPFIQASAQIALTYKDEIEAALTFIAPLIDSITALYKERAAKKADQQALGGIEFEIRLGDDRMTFKANDQIGAKGFDPTLAMDKFLEHQRQTQSQPRIAEPVQPVIIIREYVPPRPPRRRP